MTRLGRWLFADPDLARSRGSLFGLGFCLAAGAVIAIVWAISLLLH
jgi:hypothetical protein